jgi:hypothetical protein
MDLLGNDLEPMEWAIELIEKLHPWYCNRVSWMFVLSPIMGFDKLMCLAPIQHLTDRFDQIRTTHQSPKVARLKSQGPQRLFFKARRPW